MIEVYDKFSGNFLGTLHLVDPRTGTQWITDFIGDCEEISYNEELNRWEADEDSYFWWEEASEIKQKFDNRVYEFDSEVRHEIIEGIEIGRNDMDTDLTIMEEFLEKKFLIEWDCVNGIYKVDEFDDDTEILYNFDIGDLKESFEGTRGAFITMEEYKVIDKEYCIK